MKKQQEIFLLGRSLVSSFSLLRKNDPLRMAGSTAFYTTFALPPIVFILVRIFSLFISPKIMGRGLIENIGNNLGDAGAQQIREVIHSIRGFNKNWYVIIFGFLFLVFVATTLFIVIRNSLNQIWAIEVKRNSGFIVNMFARARSFAIILFVGVLFFATLMFKSIETISSNYIDGVMHSSTVYFNLIFNKIISTLIIAAWFISLFRFLADGRPTWKAACIGGILTAILFIIGRFFLKILLINSNIGELYGASGAFVLVMLFVFYTSFILYFGACFILVYSKEKQWPITINNKTLRITEQA